MPRPLKSKKINDSNVSVLDVIPPLVIKTVYDRIEEAVEAAGLPSGYFRTDIKSVAINCYRVNIITKSFASSSEVFPHISIANSYYVRVVEGDLNFTPTLS